MIYFTLIMLLLALTAKYRGPILRRRSIPWFFMSWLPGELPWLFAAIQLTVMCMFILRGTAIALTDICSFFIASITLHIWYRLHEKTKLARPILQAALCNALGKNFESTLSINIGVSSPSVIQHRDWLNPFWYRRKDIERIKNIIYGESERNRLDIYRRVEYAQHISNCPVLLHIHGGAWVMGQKHQQAQPLINYVVQNGWICVDINYRLAPRNRYPDALVDVKKAIVWIKENISKYGGNPNFIAITGESAGAHLCALAALTPNNPEFQPDFETSDTSVQAAVTVYGVYDVTNDKNDALIMHRFLENYVMPKIFLENPDAWQNASPLFQVNHAKIPMFVIHGDNDCVVPVQQARDFVEALKQKNSFPVIYAELPGAQHGFDIFHSVRTEFHIQAVGKFLHYCYTNYK